MVWQVKQSDVQSRINAHMVNVGSFASDGTGDSIREAFIKLNRALEGLEDWNIDLEREISGLSATSIETFNTSLSNAAGSGIYFDPATNTLNASQDIAQTAHVVFHAVTVNQIDVDNLTVDSGYFSSADVGNLTVVDGNFATLKVSGNSEFDGDSTFNSPVIFNEAVDISQGNIDCGNF